MRKQQRLRMLQVRHSRHRHAHGAFGKIGQRARQARDAARHLPRRVFHKHAKIGRHQFIAAARCVQLEPQRAQPLDQRHLHEVVHVFRG